LFWVLQTHNHPEPSSLNFFKDVLLALQVTYCWITNNEWAVNSENIQTDASHLKYNRSLHRKEKTKTKESVHRRITGRCSSRRRPVHEVTWSFWSLTIRIVMTLQTGNEVRVTCAYSCNSWENGDCLFVGQHVFTVVVLYCCITIVTIYDVRVLKWGGREWAKWDTNSV
jgi:hypothetical protein